MWSLALLPQVAEEVRSLRFLVDKLSTQMNEQSKLLSQLLRRTPQEEPPSNESTQNIEDHDQEPQPPIIHLKSKLTSVFELDEEWNTGLNGGVSIKEMEDKWPAWRKNNTMISNKIHKRLTILRHVDKLEKELKVPRTEVLKHVEESRKQKGLSMYQFYESLKPKKPKTMSCGEKRPSKTPNKSGWNFPHVFPRQFPQNFQIKRSSEIQIERSLTVQWDCFRRATERGGQDW